MTGSNGARQPGRLMQRAQDVQRRPSERRSSSRTARSTRTGDRGCSNESHSQGETQDQSQSRACVRVCGEVNQKQKRERTWNRARINKALKALREIRQIRGNAPLSVELIRLSLWRKCDGELQTVTKGVPK